MKILVTGAAGFIGYHICKMLIKENNFVYGLDNISNYYDVNLKKNRLKNLKSSKFHFEKIDLSKSNEIKNYFNNKNFDVIIHLAAQAGVRYSLNQPNKYIQSNIVGTSNLLEAIKIKNIKHFLIASSSSVYGNSKKKIFNENMKSDEQLSLYASTKKAIESISHSYSYNFQIPISVLRFFTVYGEWGRPDMALFNFTKNILSHKKIDLYNKGEMYRDFTYIDDVVESIKRLIKIPPSEKNRINNDSLSIYAPYRVLNIGNEKQISLKNFVQTIESIVGIKAIKNFEKMQKGDVIYTKSCSNILNELTGYKPNTNINIGIKCFYDWYKGYYNISGE